jgi:hypothetical protein
MVVHKGRYGAIYDRKYWPELLAPGRRFRQFDDERHLVRIQDASPDMFAGISEGLGEVKDCAQVGWHVAGGDSDVDDLDHIQRIAESTYTPQVFSRAVMALSTFQVNGFSALTISGMVRCLAVKHYISSRIPGFQSYDAGRLP